MQDAIDTQAEKRGANGPGSFRHALSAEIVSNRNKTQLPRNTQRATPGHVQALSVILVCTNFAHAEPFLPSEGSQVLEHIRSTSAQPGARALKELRGRLAVDPQNLDVAEQFARECIARSRSEADPRYLGRAQSALAPWWDAKTAPVDVLVLRATIRQSQHDFTNALADLQVSIERAPRNAQAWLTRATILTVLGEYAAARRACVPLAQLAPGLVALTCAASISCLNGEAENSCALLGHALEANPNAAANERIWALTVLGEASARLGKSSEAERYFKQAMAIEPRDSYLRCSYADLLLDQGRAREAVRLLKQEVRADGVLLRLALAESQLEPKPASMQVHINELRGRFEEARLRGDFVHQREEARFALHLLQIPREALRLAQENWQVQHEPADARILLESALAARDKDAARPVLDFIRVNHVNDVGLNCLAKQLEQ